VVAGLDGDRHRRSSLDDRRDPVVDGFADLQPDAAEQVDDLHESDHVHHHVVVDLESGQLSQSRLDGEARGVVDAAEDLGEAHAQAVDLVGEAGVAVEPALRGRGAPREAEPAPVAGDVEGGRLAGVRIDRQHDDRVGPHAGAPVAAVAAEQRHGEPPAAVRGGRGDSVRGGRRACGGCVRGGRGEPPGVVSGGRGGCVCGGRSVRAGCVCGGRRAPSVVACAATLWVVRAGCVCGGRRACGGCVGGGSVCGGRCVGVGRGEPPGCVGGGSVCGGRGEASGCVGGRRGGVGGGGGARAVAGPVLRSDLGRRCGAGRAVRAVGRTARQAVAAFGGGRGRRLRGAAAVSPDGGDRAGAGWIRLAGGRSRRQRGRTRARCVRGVEHLRQKRQLRCREARHPQMRRRDQHGEHRQRRRGSGPAQPARAPARIAAPRHPVSVEGHRAARCEQAPRDQDHGQKRRPAHGQREQIPHVTPVRVADPGGRRDQGCRREDRSAAVAVPDMAEARPDRRQRHRHQGMGAAPVPVPPATLDHLWHAPSG